MDFLWSIPEMTLVVLTMMTQTWIFRNLYLNMKKNHQFEFMIQKDSMKL